MAVATALLRGRQPGASRLPGSTAAPPCSKLGRDTPRAVGLSAKPVGARYQAEIDGLRAIAVLPVVLYHAGLSFEGGYVGVDIFFVISGFLITRILNDEMEAGRFSILAFYERRARRILPALFAMLGICGLLGAYALMPLEFAMLGKAAFATLLFGSNFYFWDRGSDYFGPHLERDPLLHTWSLGVEEQFYILFPLLLFGLHRWYRGRMVHAVAGLVGLSFLVSVVAVQILPVTTFYLLPTRAWELGVGALLALATLPKASRAVREALCYLAVGALGASILLYDRSTPFPGLAAAPPVLAAVAILFVSQSGGSSVTRLLSARPLVWIGLISYSLYLWHWPVLVFLKIVRGTDMVGSGFQLAAVLVSIALAWLSWRFIEQPFRSRERIPGRAIVTYSVAGGAILAAGAAATIAGNGFPARFDARLQALIAPATDIVPCPGERLANGYCRVGAPAVQPTFAMWGDSHARALAPAAAEAARRLGIAGIVIATEACPPLAGVSRPDDPMCLAANSRFIRYLATAPEIGTIVLTGRWAVWQSGQRPRWETGPPPPRLVDGATLNHGQPVSGIFRRRLNQTIGVLGNRRIVLVGGVPEIGWDVPRQTFAHARFTAPMPPPPSAIQIRARLEPANRIFRDAAARPRVEFADPTSILCQDHCRLFDGGIPIYVEDDHLSAAAARKYIAPMFESVLREKRHEGPVAQPRAAP